MPKASVRVDDYVAVEIDQIVVQRGEAFTVYLNREVCGRADMVHVDLVVTAEGVPMIFTEDVIIKSFAVYDQMARAGRL